MKDNTISNINIGGDSSYGIQLEEIKDKSPPPKSRKKLFIIIGIVVGVIVITTIVLLAVLLTKEDKKNHKLTNNNGSNKQSIELLIEGIQDSSQGRNLQENQKVQIFGETFEGLSSSNANIYFNGQKIVFNKSLNIDTNGDIKLEIELLDNIKTFKNMFKGCKGLKSVTLNNINTASVSDTSSMFEGCTGLKKVKFEKMNISNIENTAKMFQNCNNLDNIDINNFYTDKVTNMSQMFEGCSSLKNTNFISQLSTKSSKDMTEMFFGCSKLTSLDLSGFDTSNSKNMKGMFKNMASLKNLNLNNFNTKNVEHMNEMFENCTSIESLDLTSFNTKNVVDMSRMFYSCSSLKSLNLSSSFDISKCKHDGMFYNFPKKLLEELANKFEWAKSFIDKDKGSSTETTSVVKTDEQNTVTLETNEIKEETTSPIKDAATTIVKQDTTSPIKDMATTIVKQNTEDISDTSIETDEENETNLSDKSENEKEKNSETEEGQSIEILIEGKKSSESRRNLEESEEKIKIFGDSFNELGADNAFIYLDDKKLDFNKEISIKSSTTVRLVVKFTTKIMTFKEMFSGCQRIKEVSLNNVETEFVLETTSMFEGCTSLSGVKFENTGIYNITSTAKMFQSCTSLNKIEIETFSTDKTKDMSKMFEGCSSLENGTFIEGLSTKSAESMEGMLSGCSEIKSLNLSGFDTSNVKDMSGMFKGMTNLQELEISSFHTEKVEYMSEMFESCSSIINLNLSNFNTEMVLNMDKMFSSCLKLEEVDLTSFNLTNCNSTLSMFSNTTRQLMLSIEKNEEVRVKAGMYWTEKEANITKMPLDILFLVDATGSMGGSIEKVKEEIIYISVNLMNKTGMEYYDLSLAAIFYRDPIDSYSDIHQIFDFDKNALNFRNFVEKIRAKGGADGPEDWAGAFNLAKNLSWGNDSIKFIIHIADAPAHGVDWVGGYDKYPAEGNKTDEIITYFARNNFSIAGFQVSSYGHNSFKRAQLIYNNNENYKYIIKNFIEYEPDQDYFLDLVYNSFIYTQNAAILRGIDISEEQGEINWNKIREEKSIDFVIIKAGEGNTIDKRFKANYEGAKNAGIPIGIYWYAKAINTSDAELEALSCKDILNGTTFEFPIYYVIEDVNIFNSVAPSTLINPFCDTLESSTGINYLCGLRSSAPNLQTYFNFDDMDDYQIWSYDGDKSIVSEIGVNMWKFSDAVKINGIEGNVRLHQSIINYSKIALENHYNGY